MARTAVVAGTATAVSNRVSRRQAARWDQQDYDQYRQQAYTQPQPAYSPPPAQPAPSPAPAPPQVAGGGGDVDFTEQLANLAALKSQGLLSDDEFAAAKAKLLGI